MKFLVATCLSLFAFNVYAFNQDDALLRSALNGNVVSDVRPMAVVRTLASVAVGAKLKRFSSRVKNCGADLTHIKLVVQDSPLYVGDAGVVFSDGTVKTYSLAQTFNAGYESPWVDLNLFRSDSRCVASVYVEARAGNAAVKSHVQVLGSFLK